MSMTGMNTLGEDEELDEHWKQVMQHSHFLGAAIESPVLWTVAWNSCVLWLMSFTLALGQCPHFSSKLASPIFEESPFNGPLFSYTFGGSL